MTRFRRSTIAAALSVSAIALAAPAAAQSNAKVGVLSCDVSSGIGFIIYQKQTMTCVFANDAGGPVDRYTGRIEDFGVAIGGVAAGHLIWAVFAATNGVPQGALAGTYAGVGAEATVGLGVGANLLVGGSGRAFSLQPLSVQGQAGVNIAGGITSVTLNAAP